MAYRGWRRNGTPYNPSGDAISREVINSEIEKRYCSKHCVVPSEEPYCPDNCPARFLKNIVKECPTVPQVTVFTESTDEKAVADMKAELQNVIEARPNEQIAWEQGYEAGLAQGKAETRPKGEWLDESKDSLLCTCCKKRVYKPFIGGFPTERSQHYYPNFCAFCGADMRKGGSE